MTSRISRPILAVLICTGVVTAVCVGGEVVARIAFSERAATAAPTGVVIEPSGSAAWGILTGTMSVAVQIDADLLSALADPEAGELAIEDGRLMLATTQTLPNGTTVPIEVELLPVAEAGTIRVEVIGAVIAGAIEVPAQLLDTITPQTTIPVGDDCVGLRADSVAVAGDHIVVHGTIPVTSSGDPGSC